MSQFLHDLTVAVPQLIWIAIALWGLYVQPKSIRRSAQLLERAEVIGMNLSGPVGLRLKNDYLLYRVRFFTVANNFTLGVLAVLQLLHVITFGHAYGASTWFGLYGIAVIVWNEFSLNWLSWRDEKIQKHISASYLAHINNNITEVKDASD